MHLETAKYVLFKSMWGKYLLKLTTCWTIKWVSCCFISRYFFQIFSVPSSANEPSLILFRVTFPLVGLWKEKISISLKSNPLYVKENTWNYIYLISFNNETITFNNETNKTMSFIMKTTAYLPLSKCFSTNFLILLIKFEAYSWIIIIKYFIFFLLFPGSSVVRIAPFHCHRPGFIPWWGN